jgi:hypothetical protein
MITGKIPSSVGFSATDGQINRVLRLNIGLNNNPFGSEDILPVLELFMRVDSQFIKNGEYNGEIEPTLVVVGLTDRSFDAIKDILTALSLDLTQDCIAFRYGGKGDLAYRPDFTGDRYEFDEQYFI